MKIIIKKVNIYLISLIFLMLLGCGKKEVSDPGASFSPLYEISEDSLKILQAAMSDATDVKVDPDIPHYEAVSGVSGNLNSIGSDTMNNLLTLWLEGFRKYYPNVNIQVEGKGSSTAPPALIHGTAQLGPMSREMKQEEIDAFEKKFGYKPTEIRVGLDALAVYVNKDNPLKELTLTQVDAIFSKTRRGGSKEEINFWGDLGLTGDWTKRNLSLYGRNSASGTYGFFKEKAIFKGDFKDQVKEQPGSASVVQGITEDRFGIGYSGIGYVTSGVKSLPLAVKEGKDYIDNSYENVITGKYPLARYLIIYINKNPNQELDLLLKEFMKYILSYEGQEVVAKDGYLPLTKDLVFDELKKINN